MSTSAEHSNTPAHNPSISVRWHGIAAYIMVLACQFVLLYPLHTTLDLPKWDESHYMGWGAAFLYGEPLPALDFSPLYALMYAPLVALVGTVNSVFLMKYVLTIGIALLLLTFLIQRLQTYALPLLLTLVWCISDHNLFVDEPMVYRAALLFFLLALLVERTNKISALLFLAMATAVRLEYLLLLIPYALLVYLLMRRHGTSYQAQQAALQNRWHQILLLLQVGVLAVLLLTTQAGMGAGRAWFAFQQHYAFDQSQQGNFDLDPWSAYAAVIERDFPGSTSVGSALLANPGAFLIHVGRNLLRLPAVLLTFVQPAAPLRTPFILSVLVLAGLVVLLCLIAGDRQRLRQEMGMLLANQGSLHITLLLALPMLIPGLVVYAKPRYALFLVPFFLWYGGILFLAALKSYPPRQPAHTHPWVWGVVAALSLVVAVGGASGARPFAQANVSTERPFYQAIVTLQQVVPAQPITMLGVGATSYANYLGKQRVTAVEPVGAIAGVDEPGEASDMAALVRQHQPDVVVLNSFLRDAPGFDTDSIAVLRTETWVETAFGDDDLFIRAALVQASEDDSGLRGGTP